MLLSAHRDRRDEDRGPVLAVIDLESQKKDRGLGGIAAIRLQPG